MEDVQYMIEHGTRTSFLMVVDSSMRDTNAYPTPSEYYLRFPQPFKNVVSVSCVDATVPRTEYSVEHTTNTLAYAPGLYVSYQAALSSNTLVEVSIPPGDYNTSTLMQTLNTYLKEASLAKNHAPLQVQGVSVPVDTTNRITLTRSEPFTVFMGHSSIRYVLGFGTPATALGNDRNWDGSLRYTTDTNLANDTFVSIPSTKATKLAYVGPVPIENAEYAISAAGGIEQTFTAETSGLLQSIVVRGTGEEGTVVTGSLRLGDATIQNFSCTVSGSVWTATLDNDSQVLDILSATRQNGHVVLTTTEPHGLDPGELVRIDGAASFSLNGQWVLTDTTETTLTILLDIDPKLGSGVVSASKEIVEGQVYTLVIDAVDGVSVYRALRFRETVGQLTADGETYTEDALCVDVRVTNVGYVVDAPGQVNLTGERYIVIRSPDIEQHFHRDLVAFNTMTPGLGLVKLGGNSGGFRDERMNFLAFQVPEFHPVGKLHGMHIRLETSKQRVYNAHGIDHTLLMNVTMLTSGTPTSIPRTLYPNYEPNTQKMLQQTYERERDSVCPPYS